MYDNVGVQQEVVGLSCGMVGLHECVCLDLVPHIGSHHTTTTMFL